MIDNLRVLLQLSLRLDVPYTLLVYSDYILSSTTALPVETQ